jgi:uncharacterized 2Fe-2S/4Fe-4S cluster protein (DUF4445 family)
MSEKEPTNPAERIRADAPPKFRVIFQPAGRRGEVEAGTNLLEAARELGVEIESICGGRQTCGKCKIEVEEGDFAKFGVRSSAQHLTPPDEREAQYAQRRHFGPNQRLSCACEVTGDLVIRVPEESQTRKQVVRKAAGVERPISVDAPMRLYYVELPSAELKDHYGDWERLRRELEAVHGLHNLHIDPAILPTLQPALAGDSRRITATVWEKAEDGREVIRVQPGFHDTIFGLAVDVGTTTVACHLCHLRTGEILATASRMNPQVPFGEDLMSRVSYAMVNENGTERMQRAIIDCLNEMNEEVCAEAGISSSEPVEMVVVGNTTMHHLFLGVNPQELGGSPFSLVAHSALDVKARDLGLHLSRGANVHVPPCEAGHVGADNVGVLVAEAPYQQDDQLLIIDIGTNGEILLGNREEVLSASSPTGPAFEGAQIVHGMRAAPGAIERVRVDPATLETQYRIIGREEWIGDPEPMDTAAAMGNGSADNGIPEEAEATSPAAAAQPGSNGRRRREEILNPTLRASGICGSGIIEAVSELFLAGVIAPNGRFTEIDHPRMRTGLGEGNAKAEFVLAWPHETSSGQAIVLHSDDIRAIQLAKAALYAGAKLLMQRMDLETVDRIILAGGFGSYIDPRHAMVLGLIPDCDLKKVSAVGNAAGDGARMILLDKSKRREAQWAARWVTYIETAVEARFQEEFVEAINLPHNGDVFPHLEPLLAEARAQWPPERQAAVDAANSAGRGRRTSRSERRARRERQAQRG